MPAEFGEILRDAIVLGYMLLLRVGMPLLAIIFVGKWIQRCMAESDLREQRERTGVPYCWDTQTNARTGNAKTAAAAHPELPCWLAVQVAGGGVTQTCYNCPRYAVRTGELRGDQVEVG